jgi:hypothetical protein
MPKIIDLLVIISFGLAAYVVGFSVWQCVMLEVAVGLYGLWNYLYGFRRCKKLLGG